MFFLWRYFPVFYVLPFLLATSRLEAAAEVGEIVRWAVLVAGCGVAVWAGFSRARRKPGRLAVADRLMIGFIGLFLVSSVWSIDKAYTIQRTVSILLLYGCSMWALWSYVDRFTEERLLKQVLTTLGVVMTINFFVGGLLFPDELLNARFHGLFLNPNNLGMLVGVALPIGIGQWMRKRGRLELVVVGILLVNLIACGTRSALLGTGVAFALMLAPMILRRPARAFLIGGIVLIAVVGVSRTIFFQERVLREESLETGSNRTYFWELGEEYTDKRPLMGHGFATDAMINDYYGVVLTDLKLRGYGVMSSYYGMTVQIGRPATYLFFGALWGFVGWCVIFRWRDAAVVSYAAVIASGLIVCIFEPAIYSAGNCFSFLFWLVFMLLVRRVHYRRIGLNLDRSGGILRRSRELKNRRGLKRRKKIAHAAAIIDEPESTIDHPRPSAV